MTLFASSNRWLWLRRLFAAQSARSPSIITFTLLPMAEAFRLLFLPALLVTILSVIFLEGRRPVAGDGPPLSSASAGVLVVLRPGWELPVGHLAAAIGGLTAPLSIVVLRKMGPAEKRLSLYGAALLGTLIVSGILMLSQVVVPTPRQWLFLASYGLLGAAGNVLLMTAARLAPANLAARRNIARCCGRSPSAT